MVASKEPIDWNNLSEKFDRIVIDRFGRAVLRCKKTLTFLLQKFLLQRIALKRLDITIKVGICDRKIKIIAGRLLRIARAV